MRLIDSLNLMGDSKRPMDHRSDVQDVEKGTNNAEREENDPQDGYYNHHISHHNITMQEQNANRAKRENTAW